MAILAICVIAGPLGALLGLYLGGFLLRTTGAWLGGEGSSEDLRAAIAWGQVPMLWGGLIWIPALALLGRQLFTSDMGAASGQTSAPLLLLVGFLFIVQMCTAIWSIFTSLHCIGEAQGFSAWRALGNTLIAVLILLVPALIVGGVVFLVLMA